MKKLSKSLVIGLVALLLVIVAANSAYTVRENQYACTVRFSKIISTTAQPGLHFKVPFLDSVKYFSKASMLYDIPPSEVLTSDKQNMTVHRWFNSNKSCPGTFLFERMGQIANEVNKQLATPLYRVQVGAFRDKENAENFLETVKKAGFENAFIVTVYT